MKSSIAYAILHHNSKSKGSKCLYVTLEQTKKNFCRQMESMGFDVEMTEGDLHIVDVGSMQKQTKKNATVPWMELLKKLLETKKRLDGVDLIVLDSLEALDVLAQFENRRTALFHFFEWLRDLDAISFVLTEAPPEQTLLGLDQSLPRNDEGFLSDGILHLKMHQVNDIDIQRRLRVVKMRSANHRMGFFALVFEDGKFSVTRALSA
jgi:KaiC/GvpD/RAD55 family RecA-like ATPase